MYQNIVKITLPSKNIYGTGVVLSEKFVITSEHVSLNNENICIEYKGKEFIGKEKVRDEYIAIIEVNDNTFAKQYNETDDKLYFTDQEIISRQSELEIYGYYSNDLKQHFIKSTGASLYSSDGYNVDFVISNIESGKLCSYKGMSGSPVICNNRIIGILQVQTGDFGGDLGLLFASVKLFKKTLTAEFLKESEYISNLFSDSNSYKQIVENKNNLKYIPEIYIEDDQYKDFLRFFSDPALFFSKAIYELKNIFSSHLSDIYIHLNRIITKINNSNILNKSIATLSVGFLNVILSKTLTESYKEFCQFIRKIITDMQSLFGKNFFEKNENDSLGYSLILFNEHLRNSEIFLSKYHKLFDLPHKLFLESESINDCEQFYSDLDKLINDLTSKDKEIRNIADVISCFTQFNDELGSILEYIKFINKRVVLLTKGAGQGKTNFLCDFTENFLMRRRIPCIYLNASTFAELPSKKIIKILTENEKWSLNYVRDALDKLWSTSRRLVIVLIDGLNENSSNNFATMIEESIRELLTIPNLKLVMTTRSELFNERFPRLNKEVLGEYFCHVNMKTSYPETFKNRLVDGYFKHFNISVVNNSFENIFDILAENTLLLRLFCEVYQGKRQVYLQDMFVYSLFEKYYTKKRDEIRKIKFNGDILFDKVVEAISDYMISNEIFKNVPEESLNNNEIQLLEYLLTSDVVFTTDLLVTKGLLDNFLQKCVSFTFDAFRDYCLTRYLLTKDPPNDFSILWKKMHDDTWSILEGVEKYIFYMAKTTNPNLLPLLQKDNNNYYSLYWNNIWFIDEKYFTEDDITKLKCQFFDNGKNITKVCKFLLNRTDKTYYRKTSINVLFEALNELSRTPGKYDTIIRTIFPLSESNKHSTGIKNSKVVLYCDFFVEKIEIRFKEKNIISEDALRLTIYFFHILPKNIGNVWLSVASNTPSLIDSILQNYQKIDRSFIFVRRNISNIVNLLIDSTQNDMFSRYQELLYDTSEHIDVSETINEIWSDNK